MCLPFVSPSALRLSLFVIPRSCLSFHSEAEESAFAFAFAFLVVIPEGNLRLPFSCHPLPQAEDLLFALDLRLPRPGEKNQK